MSPFSPSVEDVANVLRRLNEPSDPAVAAKLLPQLDVPAIQQAAQQGDQDDPFHGVKLAYAEIEHQLREGGLLPITEA